METTRESNRARTRERKTEWIRESSISKFYTEGNLKWVRQEKIKREQEWAQCNEWKSKREGVFFQPFVVESFGGWDPVPTQETRRWGKTPVKEMKHETFFPTPFYCAAKRTCSPPDRLRHWATHQRWKSSFLTYRLLSWRLKLFYVVSRLYSLFL